ncbi:hypothetical protein PIB30_064426 [Stylosanthes scabra]|uniref:Uncharacterized protein n=1 Tax=Stylosanthes scabra TaxID=79078 RepID=A0ABU6ZKF5_9FABA|nr:hypothetical protein [Stylosanthes scabra]
MTNEQMLSPYQDTTRLMREMEIQGIPVTMANLAIHRQKEEEMRQERMRYDQILQEAAAEKAREENKGKARIVEEEDEDDALASLRISLTKSYLIPYPGTTLGKLQQKSWTPRRPESYPGNLEPSNQRPDAQNQRSAPRITPRQPRAK